METRLSDSTNNSPAPNEDAAISGHFGRRVKTLRASRGWSLETLANSSGVSRSMLSEIERERANPTLTVAFRISRAFGLPISELIEAPNTEPSLTVIRAADRTYHLRTDENGRTRTLSPLSLENDVEFYEVELLPQGAIRSAAHPPGTREFVTVTQGRLRVESAAECGILEKGDSASYRADVPHALINAGEEVAVLLLVNIYE